MEPNGHAGEFSRHSLGRFLDVLAATPIWTVRDGKIPLELADMSLGDWTTVFKGSSAPLLDRLQEQLGTTCKGPISGLVRGARHAAGLVLGASAVADGDLDLARTCYGLAHAIVPSPSATWRLLGLQSRPVDVAHRMYVLSRALAYAPQDVDVLRACVRVSVGASTAIVSESDLLSAADAPELVRTHTLFARSLRWVAATMRYPGGKFAMFGAGAASIPVLAALRDLHAHPIAIFDNDTTKHGTRTNGVPILPPQLLSDTTVLLTSRHHAEMARQLVRIGYSEGDLHVALA